MQLSNNHSVYFVWRKIVCTKVFLWCSAYWHLLDQNALRLQPLPPLPCPCTSIPRMRRHAPIPRASSWHASCPSSSTHGARVAVNPSITSSRTHPPVCPSSSSSRPARGPCRSWDARIPSPRDHQGREWTHVAFVGCIFVKLMLLLLNLHNVTYCDEMLKWCWNVVKIVLKFY
jgi:hypothetical protein